MKREQVKEVILQTRVVAIILIVVALFAVTEGVAFAQIDLEERVSRLESQARDNAESGVVFILFGAFCALWAQNTGRNAWGWFFLGLFFNVITVLVLLAKNSGDRARAAATRNGA